MIVKSDSFLFPAGLLYRSGAAFIDLFILILLYYGLYRLGVNMPDISIFIFSVVDAFFWVSTFFYYAILEWKYGATPGKMLMEIKVIPSQGKMTIWKSMLRNVLKVFSLGLLAIGYILIFFTKKRQALHDILAGCLVIKEKK